MTPAKFRKTFQGQHVIFIDANVSAILATRLVPLTPYAELCARVLSCYNRRYTPAQVEQHLFKQSQQIVLRTRTVNALNQLVNDGIAKAFYYNGGAVIRYQLEKEFRLG